MGNELCKELLKSMDQIAIRMPEIVFGKYFDKLGKNNNYILAMCDDAFKSIDVFCYAMQHIAIPQAAIVLRQLLIQVSIITLLVDDEDTLCKYIEHFKFKQANNLLEFKDLIDAVSEHFSIENNKNALKYLDYGWVKYNKGRQCSEDEMIRMAGFEDILSWRKTYLDKLAHASYTTTNFLIDGKFPIVDQFVNIAAKLFDYLCTSFYKLTSFDFVFDNVDLFHLDFRVNYQKLIDGERQ